MKFRIHYFIQNNGDGSACAIFCKNAEDAAKYDEEQGERWGDDTSSYIDVETDGNTLTYKALEKVQVNYAKPGEEPMYDEDYEDIKVQAQRVR